MSERDGPIVFERTLPLAREAAFDLLVDQIGDWWPRELTFSRDPAADLSIEPVAGGACTERLPGGSRLVWGTVLSIERPLYLRLAWQISFDRKPVPDPAASDDRLKFATSAPSVLSRIRTRVFPLIIWM